MRTATPAFAAEMIRDLTAELACRIPSAFPACRALILTGSAARGEATIARRPEGVRWLSDLELLVVTPDSADLRAAGRRLDALAADLAADCRSHGLMVKLELSPAPERYFPRVRPHLFGYELKHCGRQIFGLTNYLDRIPRFDWREIPTEDAWRLVSNRIVEWLDSLLSAKRLSPAERFYVFAKSYLDALTALSLIARSYAPSYGARFRERRVALEQACNDGCALPPGFESALEIAFRYKLDPVTGFDFLWSGQNGELADLLHRHRMRYVHDELPAALLACWRHLVAPASRRPEDIPAPSTAHPLAMRLRGWARLIFYPGSFPRDALLLRASRLLARGSPRCLIYACAARLADPREGRTEQTLEWVRRHLPLPLDMTRKTPAEWQELAFLTVEFWKRHLRHSHA